MVFTYVDSDTKTNIEILRKLKNGTDIRGIAIENSEGKANLTSAIVKSIGCGFASWLKNNKNQRNYNLKIAVGTDSRLSGPELKASLLESLVDLGCSVYDCGMTTTPSMFMTTVMEQYKCDGAVMITASHLPYYYNGLKFFTPAGGCESKDIDDILNLAIKTNISSEVIAKGKIEKINLVEDYSKLLIEKVRKSVNSITDYYKPLKGNKIIVDAGNGAGGFFADKILKELGADTEGSQFLEPDGRFPNHIPNPENKTAMESIKKAVLKNDADLGIIFDTDVDRAAIVSKDGKEINKNSLIALISSIIVKEKPGATIVTDSITSTGLTEFIDSLGGVHHRFKRGYKNVINEAKRLNAEGIESPLAIETSGHAALKENYFLDDGAYLIVKILIEMSKLKEEGKSISSLIDELKEPLESEDIRIKIKRENFKEYGSATIEGLKKFIRNVDGWSLESKNYEGVRINCCKEKGWFLLRLSLHEPVLALNIEADTIGGTEKILSKLKEFMQEYKGLEF
ncbi:phosphomannomutase/phosphoglucomutase [Clostridium fungisolvens]|uniref:Phosphomannomutase/phosphoglucomutase n=1 Tax=Clostridium fungisolvens TaxID=1604897 RepID=A0A6V8SEH9_9CLOT|nr:phosphomannomutase/phosphoglucomutase [Clostridium fungisolvens]GFP75639.1 Phosphomannomutase/phosphoglucomutase [Clostridium fungisolvens]